MSTERPHEGIRKRLKRLFKSRSISQLTTSQDSNTPREGTARRESIETSSVRTSQSEAGVSSLQNNHLLAVPAPLQASSSAPSSLHESIAQGPPLPRDYGTVNNISTAGNVLSGVNYGVVTMISENADFMAHLAERLKISAKAEYMYYPSGSDEMALRRGCCTPGTRIRILQAIIRWAMDTFPGSERVYWLSGQAGAGKSTIAYTICQYFESLVRDANTQTILGGSFFCSRQFLDTRSASFIVRTIVHQLAIKSKAFRNALKDCGRFETINHGPRSQLMGLLVEPWRESAPERLAENEPCYVIPIDALDELEGTGGQEFLSTLFEVVDQEDLAGLKFFVTSRLDPTLVQRIESFPNKQVCRLEEVPIAESNTDIKLFLDENLSQCATEVQKEQLVSDAAGLFIYATTVVEYVKGRDLDEQKTLLKRLLVAPSPSRRPSRGATATLDNLYLQILETSLVDPRDRDDPDVFQDCLSILHTFLCTIERTSASIAVEILNETQDEGKETLEPGAANGILHRLHAVLYGKGGQVMWFHKSFPDFIFTKSRSQKFFCDQGQRHLRLAEGCFKAMCKQLRFNMADIPSSYHLDRESKTLASAIDTNISGTLQYACRSWASHLILTPFAQDNDLPLALHDFLHLRFLFWLEAMNLLGYRARCQAILRDAQDWVARAKEPLELAKELVDAAAFAIHHNTSGAASSTPHLYISSLATFPRNPALLQQWRQKFSGIPEFVNATGVQAVLSSFVAEREVTAVAFAPDGVTAVLALSTGLHILDLLTGDMVKSIRGHDELVNSVAFSPAGAHVVSGSDKGFVRVWDLTTGEEVKTFQGHTEEVSSVAFSPNGTRVVSGSDDYSVRVWDLSAGEQVQTFDGHTEEVNSVAFSPDGTQVVSGSNDQSVRVWDLSTGEEVKTFQGDTEEVNSVAFSSDGTLVVSGSNDGYVRVWDLSSGEEVNTFEGHTNAVTSEDYSVRVWNLSSGEEVNTFEGHVDPVLSVAFSPNGSQVVSGSDDQSVRVWDMLAGEEAIASRGQTEEISSVAFSPDGTLAASGSLIDSSSNAFVRVWDLSTGENVKTLRGHTSDIYSVAFSPDGTRIVSGSEDNSIQVWDLSTGEKVMTFEGHSKEVNSAVFSPDNTLVLSGSDDGSVRVWDLSRGQEVTTFHGHTNEVKSVVFSPDGTLIASGSWDQSVRVWDLSTGQEVKTFEGHTEGVNSVAFSPDGILVVSGSDDYSVRVWDLLSGEGTKTFEGHVNNVTSVAFSPDGALVVSASNDYTIQVWDLSSGEVVKTFEGHADAVYSVSFSPDGTRIVSASSDCSIRLWDCRPEHTQARFLRQKSQEGNNTGWLLSPSNPSAHLMFVPLLANLTDDSNLLTIPSTMVPKLDLSKAKVGDRWAECYTPKSL